MLFCCRGAMLVCSFHNADIASFVSVAILKGSIKNKCHFHACMGMMWHRFVWRNRQEIGTMVALNDRIGFDPTPYLFPWDLVQRMPGNVLDGWWQDIIWLCLPVCGGFGLVQFLQGLSKRIVCYVNWCDGIEHCATHRM